MKFTSVIVSALATLATAAPAKSIEGRVSSAIDLAGLNNLNSFNSVDIQYLAQINGLDLNLLLALGQNNGLQINSFNSLFQGNNFDLQQILQLQQLQTLLSIAGTGALNSFDLSSIILEQQLLQLGLINNIGSFGFGSLIDQSLVPQIQTIAQQFGEFTSS
jgi:hypothetical protein